ncbi:MAG: hypothetical protein REJ24_02475 [Rhodocyclaceae bacterium]|nr:hypothetical protein [Pseudomonadota bacterium]MDQ7971399.1 hypothetical protein [Rhodocyclaceae bacterium]MDQ8000467.1 hypothetical protein [Pseudomonadota bacterium]MDQ8016254.1 hypothetical protein [Pseudomonadota bacterium]
MATLPGQQPSPSPDTPDDGVPGQPTLPPQPLDPDDAGFPIPD